MQSETIIAVLLSAARFLKEPLQDAAVLPLTEAYEATKGYLKKKFGDGSEAAKALESAVAKPDSDPRKAVLLEESAITDLSGDTELLRLIRDLKALLPKTTGAVRQTLRVSGRGHRVEVAGRDIIKTERHIQRNIIRPDERHISAEQLNKLKPLIEELAYRLAGEDGKPKFSSVYSRLQRTYGVPSYLLIPREKGDDAVALLKQQRAINRPRLRRRDPQGYANDFFRIIHTCRQRLGWSSSELYQFAFESIPLRKPITTLKQLGPIQLKSLSERVKARLDRSGS